MLESIWIERELVHIQIAKQPQHLYTWHQNSILDENFILTQITLYRS